MPITVSKLVSYPLKSAKAHFLQSTDVTPRGLENDRLWMVIDPLTNNFISQRPLPNHAPRLALVHAAVLRDGDLMLDAVGMNAILASNPNNTPGAKPFTVTMHGKELPALDAGNEAALWLSNFLDRPARLVRFPDNFIRQVDPGYARPGDNTAYADGYPILVASEESHAALGVTSGLDRFRANIEFRGMTPFEEDSIASMQIGDVILELQKPCKRCPMPAVNQDTGQLEKEGNPLPILGRLRRGDGGEGLKGAFFGVNASPTTFGRINVGDEVKILRRHDLHPAVATSQLRYIAQ